MVPKDLFKNSNTYDYQNSVYDFNPKFKFFLNNRLPWKPCSACSAFSGNSFCGCSETPTDGSITEEPAVQPLFGRKILPISAQVTDLIPAAVVSAPACTPSPAWEFWACGGHISQEEKESTCMLFLPWIFFPWSFVQTR